MNSEASPFDVTCDSYRYLREGVLLWDGSPSQTELPHSVQVVTQEGVYEVTSWLNPAAHGDPDFVDKVLAVILSFPNNQMYMVSAEPDPFIDPIEVIPAALCSVPSVLPDVYELRQRLGTPLLSQFVTNVFSLRAVFQAFWTATAGSKHHAWPGGLAWHSLEVSQNVVEVMASRAPGQVNFTDLEQELGLITALLHDVGKTISYTDRGYCTERALTVGHELLGVELIRKPLDTLRTAQPDLADALTALLLSRTRFASSRYRLEAIRQVVCKADAESARRNTKPR